MTLANLARALKAAPAAAVLLAGLSSCGRPAADRPSWTSAETDSLLQFYAKDRAETEDWLKTKPTSYLATVQRKDFENRPSLTVGSAGRRRAHRGRRGEAAACPRHGHEGLVPRRGARSRGLVPGPGIHDDRGDAPPSAIRVGRYTLRLSHQRFPGIIVFDPQSPRFAQYKGMKFFPADVSYRVVARSRLVPGADTTIILSTRGNRRRAVRVGWFEFALSGKRHRLEATRLLEPGVGEDVSLFFTDATTGKESYSVERYLDPEPLPTAATCSTSTAATTRPAPIPTITTAPFRARRQPAPGRRPGRRDGRTTCIDRLPSTRPPTPRRRGCDGRHRPRRLRRRSTGRSENIVVELVSEHASVQPGRPFQVGLRMKLKRGWHTYWKQPGDAGMPLRIEWTLPSGFRPGPIEWPVPERIPTSGLMSYGYEERC